MYSALLTQGWSLTVLPGAVNSVVFTFGEARFVCVCVLMRSLCICTLKGLIHFEGFGVGRGKFTVKLNSR